MLPTSSAAIWAASTEPLPPISEYRLDMSLSTPSLIVPLLIWASAAPHPSALASATNVLIRCFMVVPPRHSCFAIRLGRICDYGSQNLHTIIASKAAVRNSACAAPCPYRSTASLVASLSILLCIALELCARAEMASDVADVIVVGAGNAAFCAALAAREQGASVLVLEAAPEDESGGNSRFTAGSIRVVYN